MFTVRYLGGLSLVTGVSIVGGWVLTDVLCPPE